MRHIDRLFALALLAVVIAYGVLYRYDSSDDPRLYTVIAAALAVGFVLGALHMMIDRGLGDWTANAIAIVLILTSMAALFSYLFYQRQYGRVGPGVQQGWIDVVVAAASIGLPIFYIAIGRYRWKKHRHGRATRPSDEVLREWQPGDADRRHLIRRHEDRALRGVE